MHVLDPAARSKARAALLSALLALLGSPAAASNCAALTQLSTPTATVDSAVDVAPPTTIGGVQVPQPFCRVMATLKPTTDSNIKVEVWLPPSSAWNRRMLGTGGGGYGGDIRYGALADGLRRNYATATTDLGTSPSTALNGDPLIGHPEKQKDWGHRATHLMTVFAKSAIRKYYAAYPAYSYFSGCSTGGQQGMMLAQRYPYDYDGILAGAPANQRTRLHTTMVWHHFATRKLPGVTTPLIPDSKLALVQKAAIRACGSRNGGVASDPFIGDPRGCNFDPGTLACTAGDGPDCLSQAQVKALRMYYWGPTNPQTGELLYPGAAPGTELMPLGLSLQQTLEKPLVSSLFYWVFGPNWDWRTFDFNRDVARTDTELGPIVNATDAALSTFKQQGKKMIVYHGFADPLITPYGTLFHYWNVAARQGSLANARSFMRLYMAPGLAHCSGGPGPNVFGGIFQPQNPNPTPQNDMLKALEQWVEKGVAPERILATKYEADDPMKPVVMRRPLCAYPTFARYTGTGDTNDPANFACTPAP
jgi:feruloyl esterase